MIHSKDVGTVIKLPDCFDSPKQTLGVSFSVSRVPDWPG